ncbi:MAG TPA: 4-hydroxy-tetrahydrodipicolinate synthase [Candidatus Faecousia intestinigallinarum]|nr:4-hydroxy-tetrahydrodipicolinate synthase [Candidatus Faecousia intestinigallinarum]
MNHPLFSGVCTALVTPFLGERINYPMAQQLLKRQMAAGISAVVLAGTTGESPTLSDSEKLELIRRCKEYAGEDCLIIAGTGSNSTAHTVELSIAAQEAGADALLIVSPYYNKATPDGLFAHYLSVAHRVELPIILYNVPSRTGLDMPVSVYQRLSRIPNIVGVKEASADITKVTKIRRACGEDFSVWAGNDELAVAAMALGGQGVISVASNILPEEMQAMASAALDGDLDTAAALQCQLQPLNQLLACEVNPIPVKAALQAIGYDCGICRLPLTAPTVEHLQMIQEFFQG